MIKRIITEISEEDFRKLDLKVYKTERIETEVGHRFELIEKNINDILDKEIEICLNGGTEKDLADLKCPVTIAIHEEPCEEDYEKAHKDFTHMAPDVLDDYVRRLFVYLDKYMNCYTGAQTFQIGWGIEHLYSTRDYYECHDDYWRVRKAETKVIYRVKLSNEWLKKFVLKHRDEVIEWPYDFVPEGVSGGYEKAYLIKKFDLVDGSWKETFRYGLFKYKNSEHHIPVDENGYAKKIPSGNC